MSPCTPADRRAAADSLEAAADRLLREHSRGHEPLEYPFYAPSTLRQLSRREELISQRELQAPSPASDRATLLLDRLTLSLSLTDENCVLLELIRLGHTIQEAATQLGLSEKAVQRRLERIIGRLRHRAAAAGGYDRLVREVYAEQNRPQRYHPEQHCKPGAEACRKDGRCQFRWYLYSVTAQEAE